MISFEKERPKKRTRIVATLGPASSDEKTLRGMIMAGLDVARINFSHSKREQTITLIRLIRRLSEELQTPVAIMGDLRGPRIRVGEIEGGSIELQTGQKLTLTPEKVIGTTERVSISFAELAGDVEAGSIILLDDGNIELEVIAIRKNGEIDCRVIQGNPLSSHRGINLPGLRISLPAITDKDFVDVDFAIEQEFDFLALSFVQSVEDVCQLKAYLAEKEADIPIIAKIERKSALDDIEAIVKEVYGVMVARGDLALEMSIQSVPIAQKRIIAICRETATPVITATQMLESMIEMHKPTRAEATDVANAILDGSDAIMLSGETAIGHHPVEVVATMSTIAMRTEQAWLDGELPEPPNLPYFDQIGTAVAYAGYMAAERLSARAIVAFTTSGTTARRVACHRPMRPVLAISPFLKTQRRLALSWGITCALTKILHKTDEMIQIGLELAQANGLAEPGEVVVMIAGTPPYGRSGHTNTLKIERIPTEVDDD